jgi:glycosyltransferase involved in cell wall biosynthesis
MVASGLKERGWRVHIISLIAAPKTDHRTETAQIPITSLDLRNGGSGLGALIRLIRELRRQRPDALITFMYHANVLGRIASKFARIPVVVSSVRNEFFGGRSRDLLEMVTAPLADVTVTNSVRVGDALVRRRVIPANRLRIIPNGVAIHASTFSDRAELRRELGVGSSDFLWLAIGRLEEQKDYPNLIDAARRISGTHPSARFCIAGHGRLRAQLDEMIAADGAENIQLLGFRSDIGALLNAADGLVLSSAWEGSPNAVIEAMAAGVITVATDVGGVRDLLQDGETGWIVPPRDPGALADALTAAMDTSVADRLSMGAAARTKIATQWSSDVVCDSWHKLLNDLLEDVRTS